MAIEDAEKKSSYNNAAKIFLGFAALCFFTSLFLNMTVGTKLEESIPPAGGTVGPIEVKSDFSVYLIKVKQGLSDGSWSFVGGDVLDENKNYLFGFGKEFWRESGYDSDGRWQESDTSFDMKVTFPKKGKYYLKFNAEMSQSRPGGTIKLTVLPKRGSSLAHISLGILGILIAVVLWARANVTSGDWEN